MPFNLNYNQKAARKLLVTAVNAGTPDAPEWEVVGRGVQDSSIEFNPDIETVNDILGNTETDVKSFEMSQDLEPMTVRGGSKLALKIYDINKRRAYTEFAQFEVLLIFGYVSTPSDGFTAEKHINCTVTPQSEGGDAHVDMPITITFSGDKELGLVDKLTNGMTFRKEEMVWIPAFRNCDVLEDGDNELHPAFIVNGKPLAGIWIGKYQASDDGKGVPQSKYGQTPWTDINFDDAASKCAAKGKGWHLMTNAEWAAIALWCKKNGTQPKGNNDYGKDHTETEYVAEPATYGDDDRINLVKTGTGPVTWSHDGTENGIYDLNGNVWEWVDGLRLVWGEAQFKPNPGDDWKALDAATGKFVTPECKTTDTAVKASGSTVKLDRVGGVYTWGTGISTPTSNWESTAFGSVAYATGIGANAKKTLQLWGLGPDGTAADYKGDHFWAQTKYSERLPYRGGHWTYGADAGVFALILSNPRSYVNVGRGFRLAYYDA